MKKTVYIHKKQKTFFSLDSFGMHRIANEILGLIGEYSKGEDVITLAQSGSILVIVVKLPTPVSSIRHQYNLQYSVSPSILNHNNHIHTNQF